MKLPELPKRKPKAPKAASSGRSSLSSVKAPAFLEDLYKDMRDRRLIIPAVVLLIAIVALPVMLSESADTTVNTPVPVEDPSAIAVEPAVLAVQEVGVRDFRERLDALKRKNPFGDRFVQQESDEESAGDLLNPEAGSPNDGTGVTDPAVTGTPPTDSPPASPTDPTDPTEPPEPQEPFVLVPRVNVEVGVAGEKQKKVENVRSGDLLPDKDRPVLLYLGNSGTGGTAEFLVSRDVSKVGGEGECQPEPTNCEFLTLGEGQRSYLIYADDKRYAIKVTDISFKRVPASEFDQND